jgi:hypothetical protein
MNNKILQKIYLHKINMSKISFYYFIHQTTTKILQKI